MGLISRDRMCDRTVRASFSNGNIICSQLVKIIVGQTKTEFFIHKSLLLPAEFFKRALDGNEWAEKEDNTVTLPEMTAEIFAIYAKWMYTSIIHSKNVTSGLGRMGGAGLIKNVDQESEEWYRLACCYALGSFLQDMQFLDTVIDACAELILEQNALNASFIATVCEHSSANSRHRLLMMHFAAYCTRYVHHTDALSKDFLTKVFEHMRKQVDNPHCFFTPKSVLCRSNPCKYHDHGQSYRCYKTEIRRLSRYYLEKDQ
ncbi:hypothetical protein BU23DRAFT_562722 [Bimuria novae-zelandiae CBS 107.79]|uniref:BTB domain-containing protein n=1 Tax=Bimuria novae-zelandiae CBS 107.79 TaxID=1447943 RepID=A0A6A5VX54_9PLEO|nr:hypothetical protein BU23DRAFT_562722 [Bimuria novae-zelandiae CBS 107.79]